MSGILAAEERGLFTERFNRTCFSFAHRLDRFAVFDVANLVALSERAGGAYYSTQDSGVSAGWNGTPGPKRSLRETLETIAHTNSLVLLKDLEKDPEIAPIFREVLDEVGEAVGDALRADVSIGRATLIVGSPHRVTPYHIDAEANFLFQLRGSKTVNIFDANDRTLLTHEELERFYSGDLDAARYRSERQSDARVFDFAPGMGLHLPILAPHWTRNGDDVSVGISINCTLRSNDKLRKVYRTNALLRRFGFSPAPPGSSPTTDRVKLAAATAFAAARGLVSRRSRAVS